MLYETLRQSVITLGMLYFGILGGVLFELKDIVQMPFKTNKFLKIIIDALSCFLLSLVFLFAVNFTNYGEIRLYIIFSFLLGFLLERISIGILVAKGAKFLYNRFIMLLSKIKMPKWLTKKESISEREKLEINS
jgi:hypothetical protein